MDEKMNQHSQAENSSMGNENRNENYRNEGSEYGQSQKMKSSEYGQENRGRSEEKQEGNKDSDWKSQQGHSQSMQSEVDKDRDMGNDVERMHTEGDEPNLGQSVEAEKDWQKSANDGSQSGAMSSETGKSEPQYNGPFKEGASENTSYKQGESQYQHGEGQNQSKN